MKKVHGIAIGVVAVAAIGAIVAAISLLRFSASRGMDHIHDAFAEHMTVMEAFGPITRGEFINPIQASENLVHVSFANSPYLKLLLAPTERIDLRASTSTTITITTDLPESQPSEMKIADLPPDYQEHFNGFLLISDVDSKLLPAVPQSISIQPAEPLATYFVASVERPAFRASFVMQDGVNVSLWLPLLDGGEKMRDIVSEALTVAGMNREEAEKLTRDRVAAYLEQEDEDVFSALLDFDSTSLPQTAGADLADHYIRFTHRAFTFPDRQTVMTTQTRHLHLYCMPTDSSGKEFQYFAFSNRELAFEINLRFKTHTDSPLDLIGSLLEDQ